MGALCPPASRLVVCGRARPTRAGMVRGTCRRLQAHSDGTLVNDRRWRRIRPPDGGRWWQIVGTRCKNRRQDGAGDCRGALPQKRGGGSPRGGPAPRPAFAGKPTARTPSHLDTSAPTVAHFAKPARKPRRERAENPKTIRNTARRTVKTLNKGPNFRIDRKSVV